MYTNDDLKNLSDEDKKRKRHSVEMDLVMLESDNRKVIEGKNNLESEIRKLGIDQERIRITLDEKKQELEKKSYQIGQNEEEIKRLRKKMNLLHF
jgi:cupin superfamily acireductone dioxygenase involved in methionine salvage